MKLVFSGLVENVEDHCRVGSGYGEPAERVGSVWIGGRDFVKEVGEAPFSGKVTVAIASDFLLGNTTFEGALKVAEGWGYSEYTPMESDELSVGPHDILKQLLDLEGKNATVWIADEPINVLEGAIFEARSLLSEETASISETVREPRSLTSKAAAGLDGGTP